MKFSRQGELGDLWRKAGLINVKEQALVIDQAYSSFKDYWEPFTKGAGPGGAFVVSLSEGLGNSSKRMRERLLGDRQDGPFALKARARCAGGCPRFVMCLCGVDTVKKRKNLQRENLGH